jgi:hypothetical protein
MDLHTLFSVLQKLIPAMAERMVPIGAKPPFLKHAELWGLDLIRLVGVGFDQTLV